MCGERQTFWDLVLRLSRNRETRQTKLEKVNHPAAEGFFCSTVGLVVPTVLLKVVLASQAVFWLVQTQSVLVVSFFEVQTLVSKQNVWNLPKLEPTQSCHHHCTVRYGLLFMSTNGFCDGLLRQFFTGTTVVSLQTCLQTRTRFLEFLAWIPVPDSSSELAQLWNFRYWTDLLQNLREWRRPLQFHVLNGNHHDFR